MSLVLVVEDNPVNVKLFTMLLTKSGYEVEVAGTAEDGVEQARRLQPKLIIMDLQLPGEMDGVKATQVLKEDPTTNAIPILVVTAHALPEIREAAENAGCDGFLTKPVVSRTFIAAIENQLAKSA